MISMNSKEKYSETDRGRDQVGYTAINGYSAAGVENNQFRQKKRGIV